MLNTTFKPKKVTLGGKDVHRCNNGIWRATPGPFDHAVHLVRPALHHRLHRAIESVSHPAPHAQGFGLSDHRPSVKNALNAPANLQPVCDIRHGYQHHACSPSKFASILQQCLAQLLQLVVLHAHRP